MVIAIDGFSACGKSTMAKALAKQLGAVYIDTGAMYRAVTLYFIRNKIDLTKQKDVASALEKIHITENVEVLIRSKDVSALVSEVAAISQVRRKLVELQRFMSDHIDVVLDGRDIGTVVFPNADVKLFITADPLIRARRRLDEYEDKGVKADLNEVLENLKKRDHIDSTREDSPLKTAEDAIVIDNSVLTREEQLEMVLKIVKESEG
ncbi:UNVERIFIED_CONTAM: hypothetical protein GTU68_052363 [Idotea baltica]|nr:hypothetical protein [Idotea baltica]